MENRNTAESRRTSFGIVVLLLASLMLLGSRNASAQEETPTPIPIENTRIAFIWGSDVHVMTFPDISTIRQVTHVTPGPSSHPSWSPDGSQIVFDAAIYWPPESASTTTDIFKVNLTTGDVVQLTEGSAEAEFPVWSPNGEHIAYVSNQDGNWEVYIMDSDGSNQTRVTHHDAADGYNGLTWSPDGRFLAFISRRDEGRETLEEDYEFEHIYVIDMDTFMAGSADNTIVNITAHINMCPAGEFYRNLAWSVNDALAFSFGCSDSWDIYMMDVSRLDPDTMPSPVNLTQSERIDGAMGLDWSPDGRKIVFVSYPGPTDGNRRELYVMDVIATIETNEPHITQLTHNASTDSAYDFPAWGPAE